MAVYDTSNGRQQVANAGEIDYVANGNLYIHQVPSAILVGAKSDQSVLTGYTPGSIAFTAGYTNMWQLDVDGTTWAVIVEASEEA